MRVELAKAVFTSDDGHEEILALLRCFSRGRHEWIISPLDVYAIEAFLHRCVPTRADVYLAVARKSAVQAAAWTPPDSRATVRIAAEYLAECCHDLELAAIVLVENNNADGAFIRAVARAFGATDLLTAIEHGWLRIEHGGGQDEANRCAREERERFLRLGRVAALFDSDRMVPAQRTKAHQYADELRDRDVCVHVLELREAENYLPNKVLAASGRRREISKRLDSLRRLSYAQRGYYDMKKGFRGTVPNAQRALYADVPRQVIDGLATGFGKDVIRTLDDQAHPLTEADFASVGPGVADELRGLLAMLRAIV